MPDLRRNYLPVYLRSETGAELGDILFLVCVQVSSSQLGSTALLLPISKPKMAACCYIALSSPGSFAGQLMLLQA